MRPDRGGGAALAAASAGHPMVEREVAMEFAIDMGVWGAVLLIVGALVIGVAAQFIGDVKTNYHWIIVAVAALIGGLFASEFIVDWRTFEPVWEGLALIPALIGGLVVGVIVDVIARYATGGSYTAPTA